MTCQVGFEVSMNNLSKIRKEKGISQLKLSFLTGISPGEISRIENLRLVAYPGWRKRFAEALGVTEAELFPDGEREHV